MNVDDQRPIGPGAATALLVALALTLHLAGPSQVAPTPLLSIDAWQEWSGRADSLAVASDTVRLLALVTCYHLLAMQALAAFGRRVGVPSVCRLAESFTPPPLRAALKAVAGVGLTAVTTLGPGGRAGAEPSPSYATMHVVDPIDTSTVTMEVIGPDQVQPSPDRPRTPPTGRAAMVVDGPTDGGDGAVAATSPSADPPPRSEAAVQVGGDDVEDRHHVVRPGDHLWSIAEAEVSNVGHEPVDDGTIERYWHRLVRANPQIEDPDLVFPGDVITLPPVGHTG